VWETLKFHTSHVAWTGCSLHDLIQPSFSFLVGVALPFSIAAPAPGPESLSRDDSCPFTSLSNAAVELREGRLLRALGHLCAMHKCELVQF
jgi:hypothetical protein